MSLANAIFTLGKSEQQEAIRVLAAKCDTRREFDCMIRPLLHVHYSGGATKEESKQLRHEWRQIYQSTKSGAQKAVYAELFDLEDDVVESHEAEV
jgi:hypothetical protein